MSPALPNGDHPAFRGRSHASIMKRGSGLDYFSTLQRQKPGHLRRMSLYQDLTLERTFFFTIWIFIQLAILFAVYFKDASSKPSLSRFANATGHGIMFSTSVILVFMAPTFLSALRYTFISRFVAIDKNIHAHKVAAYTTFFWMFCHVSVYLHKFSLGAAKAHLSLSKYVTSSLLGRTGIALFVCYLLIFITSIPVIRRRCFELFYYTHHLFIVCIILTFLHHDNANFYKYFIGPGVIYFSDRLYRMTRAYWGTPCIRTVIQHTRNVVELHIEKRRMAPVAGQYIYIMCPAINPFQWHPFTITSSPHEDFVSVHISAAGGWTRNFMKRLGCNFESASPIDNPPGEPGCSVVKQEPLLKAGLAGSAGEDLVLYMDPVTRKVTRRSRSRTKSVVLHQDFDAFDMEHQQQMYGHASPASSTDSSDTATTVNSRGGNGGLAAGASKAPSLPTIFVDGPYGAPTEQVFHYQVGVLIGAGIGATPFASVLKYLHFCYSQSYRPGSLRKVYFIWVCREFKSLEWFIDMLASLDRTRMTEYLEIRVYLTEQLGVDNIHNLSLHHNTRGGRDSITNLKHCVTYFGRPKFSTIFNYIGKKHPGSRTGVFFCGPKSMGRAIRRESQEATKSMMKINGTKFRFHKENF
ncbi:hypothetical protein EV182_002297 [Spiromyces aspiralis]|uniref:Uncharacterized protein n=1 Tax=Spiromyces aspiralis TaxID=68401 RepID=A0ACC1HVF1_9FUNG|nr:hypothetical protein EV182_002297 [Spiromyces aspiralis]